MEKALIVRNANESTRRLTPEDHSKIGYYAAENGVTRPQNHFKSLDLSKSTVSYFKKTYLAGVSKSAQIGDSTKVSHLKIAKHGRKVTLGEKLNAEIRWYIQRLRDETSISTALVQAAAEGYLIGRDCTVPVEYGGHFFLIIDWAQSLLI